MARPRAEGGAWQGTGAQGGEERARKGTVKSKPNRLRESMTEDEEEREDRREEEQRNVAL